ncbi:hypothetical protein MBLNU459_g3125t1 [Dothideomycetes sp. NU459]
MPYSYKIAMDVLSDTDKNRLVAVYLNSDGANVDWQRATTAFGAASVESMKVMVRMALKKIEKAGGKDDVYATTKPINETPKKTAKAGRPAKRKTAEEVDDDDDDDEDGVVTKPTPKKRNSGRKAKNEIAVYEDGDAEGAAAADEGTIVVASTPKTSRGHGKKAPAKPNEDDDRGEAKDDGVEGGAAADEDVQMSDHGVKHEYKDEVA